MRIAIIGGGIGGLSASLALRQFGFEPEVFEQAPELLEVGAAIAVWPNAMRLLQRLGIGEVVIQHAGVFEQVRWLSQDGRLLNQVRFQKTDAPAVALHRAELQSVLVRALPAESIHLGRVFSGWQQKGDVVTARFADGLSVECDLLIGADGLHSRVRAQLLGDGPPTACGYTTWRGIADPIPAATSPGTAVEIYGRGRRFGIGPVGQGRIGWWATVNDQDPSLDKEMRRSTGVPAPSAVEVSHPLQRELLPLFDSWCEPVLELIQATPATSIVKNEVFDRPPTRTWGVGPVILLGDAVHPTTPNLGQGGCLAIEDAVVLARCLHQCSSTGTPPLAEISRALRTYEELRRARTSAITSYSRRYGAVGQWEGATAVRLRNRLLALLPPKLTQRLLQMVFSYDAYAINI